jgi:hypothetical protein
MAAAGNRSAIHQDKQKMEATPGCVSIRRRFHFVWQSSFFFSVHLHMRQVKSLAETKKKTNYIFFFLAFLPFLWCFPAFAGFAVAS